MLSCSHQEKANYYLSARTTTPSGKHPLDGLFLLRFDHADAAIRSRHLEALYRDKGLMLQAATAFVVIFLSFVSSPEYWVRGISGQGIKADGN